MEASRLMVLAYHYSQKNVFYTYLKNHRIFHCVLLATPWLSCTNSCAAKSTCQMWAHPVDQHALVHVQSVLVELNGHADDKCTPGEVFFDANCKLNRCACIYWMCKSSHITVAAVQPETQPLGTTWSNAALKPSPLINAKRLGIDTMKAWVAQGDTDWAEVDTSFSGMDTTRTTGSLSLCYTFST